MRLLVVDGNSIVNRAFYGIRPLTTKDGQFTNAIYGFLTMLYKIKNEENPDSVAIAFDLKTPTFRHKAYSGYKANRKGMPEELASQMPLLKELLGLLGYKIVTCEGYEADDILGTLASACEKSGNECVIATGDRDSLQLVSDKTYVHLCTNRDDILYTPDKIMEDYGVTPVEMIELKAIQGDSSDNIPGVAGIGPKGAGDLIKRFHNIDYIYEHIDEIDIKDGIRKKLKNSKDNAFMSRMLGEICRTAPINTDVSSYKSGNADRDAAARFMAKLELFSLIEKYGLNDIPQNEQKVAEKVNFEVAEDFDDNVLLKNIKAVGKVCILCDIALKELNSFAVLNNEKVYVSKNPKLLEEILSDNTVKKYTHGCKAIFAYADKNGFEVNSLAFDTELAAYLLEPSSKDYSDENLCAAYEIDLPCTENENYKPYCVLTVYEKLCDKLSNRIKANEQEKLLSDIEIPLANVLAKMENIGFDVDRQGIEDYGKVLSSQIESLKSEIYQNAGEEFNINSPKQLGKVLFEDLQLPCKKKTKSGYSTNADVLESLRYQHPIVDMVLNYRTLAKLNSTYCEGLLKVIGDDGRIHSSFNQTETRTGRISSTEPNLQNIPVRTELGREMRKFFCAKDGWTLVDADYSQIELRVLAHISHDKNMIEAFKNNDDIHAITASQVFNMPLDMVTPIMRSRAKAVNFGIVYGIGAFSLAKDIGVSNKEASQYIKNYLAHYSGVDEYMKNVVEKAKQDGYVETMFGRRRYLPELTSGKAMLRKFGERVARNMPIQGTAADIIKIAMIRVNDRLKKEGLQSRLILQIHDELIVEAPIDESLYIAKLLQEEMENAVALDVPLTADAAVGKTWYDAKG
ncbi:MAG: DNA polymerase I [Ruminococcus bromii]|nr:DNA polymerase I [Ruminococcus bromii]MDY4711059.1 DNA polymerase I [Ruminococcus bromii]